jgi:hypothetical protein
MNSGETEPLFRKPWCQKSIVTGSKSMMRFTAAPRATADPALYLDLGDAAGTDGAASKDHKLVLWDMRGQSSDHLIAPPIVRRSNGQACWVRSALAAHRRRSFARRVHVADRRQSL